MRHATWHYVTADGSSSWQDEKELTRYTGKYSWIFDYIRMWQDNGDEWCDSTMYMGEVKYFKENFGQNNFESLNKKKTDPL